MPSERIADPILYRLYWGVQMPDILHKLGFDATEKNKKILHEFHKRVLNYKTIAGESRSIVSLFLFEVLLALGADSNFIHAFP